jgi:ankyrin repeat protein
MSSVLFLIAEGAHVNWKNKSDGG